VWRSVRVGGDTKTPKSRRTLALSDLVVGVLTKHKNDQDSAAAEVGNRWKDHGLVFPSEVGTPQDRHNVLRMFRSALTLVPGVEPQEWTPRDLRHSFVSILSQSGLPIQEISTLMGHSGIAVNEVVYRHELRPVIQSAASVMDDVFWNAPTTIDTDGPPTPRTA